MEEKRICPWPNWDGKPIKEGDTIGRQCDLGTVIFLEEEKTPEERWKVRYGDGMTLKLFSHIMVHAAGESRGKESKIKE